MQSMPCVKNETNIRAQVSKNPKIEAQPVPNKKFKFKLIYHIITYFYTNLSITGLNIILFYVLSILFLPTSTALSKTVCFIL